MNYEIGRDWVSISSLTGLAIGSELLLQNMGRPGSIIELILSDSEPLEADRGNGLQQLDDIYRVSGQKSDVWVRHIRYDLNSTILPKPQYKCQLSINDSGILNESNAIPIDLIIVDGSGGRRLKVDGNIPKTAFGEVQVASMTPVIQITAQYGLRAEVESVAIGGSAAAEDSKFIVSTGTGSGNISSIASTRLATYRAGQGLAARFTALFTQGVENSSQVAGLLTSESILGLGYDGADFGIVHARGGELEQWELQITSSAGGSENATIIIDGNPYLVPLTSGSVEKNAYEISASLNSQVIGYSFSSVSDTVMCLAALPDLGGGAFTFSSPSATAVFTQIQSGLIPPEVWVKKADWNVKPEIEIDPTLGNVYQVQMQYLGFGGIKFYIEDPKTALFELVHIIRYANSSSLPSVTNPIFRIGWGVRNKGNTSNIVTQGASGAIFIEGDIVVDGSSIGASQTQTGVSTTKTSVISLQNRRTYYGTANRAEIIGRSLVLSTDTGKTAKFELILNPVIATGDFLDFESLGDDNLGELSRSAAEVTGGKIIAAYDVKSASSFKVDIGDVTSRLQPGDILCVAAAVSSGGQGAEMSAALTWQDDL